MKGIFKSAEQAVHFAFIMEAYPATPRDTLATIRSIDACRTGRPSDINFGSLTPSEIRSECAGIRRGVLAHLSSAEGCALVAKFSSRHARSEYDRTIALGVVEHHFWPVVQKQWDDRNMFHTIVRRHYAQFERHDPTLTLRAIAAKHGVSKERVQRVARYFEGVLRQLETVALDNLRREFEQKGIIAEREENHAG